MFKSTVLSSLLVLAGWINGIDPAAAHKDVTRKMSAAPSAVSTDTPDTSRHGGTCRTPKECCIQAGGWWHNGYCI
jgi:hypothetical protein